MNDGSENSTGYQVDPEIKRALALPMDKFEEWIASLDVDPPPPSAYPLCTDEGRRGFLEAYIWRGEAALFESVTHIWNSLNPPKSYRCTLIGLAAKTGGNGKKALIPFLRKALRESLDDGLVQPCGGFSDIDEFHQASMDYFAASYSHYERSVQKYANLLNGEAPDVSPEGEVIEGPWIAAVENREPQN